MRISDLFGSNKNVATINFYCQKYGITMPESEEQNILEMLRNNSRFCVFIDKSGIDLLRINERSVLIGKIVGARVKRGVVLYFHDGAYRVVICENWNETWKMLIPKPERIVDDRIIVPIRKRTMFEDALPERPPKKMSKRGFSRTHTANLSMMRMQSIHTKILVG